MALWRFMDFHSEISDKSVIDEWYRDLDVRARADFDTTLKNLSIVSDWRGMKEFKHLGRKGLCEIRFKTANVQYRIAGFFGPGGRTFSLFIGATKKQKIYDPPDAFEKAIKRKDGLRQGKGKLRERVI